MTQGLMNIDTDRIVIGWHMPCGVYDGESLNDIRFSWVDYRYFLNK